MYIYIYMYIYISASTCSLAASTPPTSVLHSAPEAASEGKQPMMEALLSPCRDTRAHAVAKGASATCKCDCSGINTLR